MDILGDRDKALKQYRYVVQMNKEVYGDIIELAYEGIKNKYKKRYAKHLNINIWNGEDLTAQ